MNGMRVGFCAGIIEPKVRSVPHSHPAISRRSDHDLCLGALSSMSAKWCSMGWALFYGSFHNELTALQVGMVNTVFISLTHPFSLFRTHLEYLGLGER